MMAAIVSALVLIVFLSVDREYCVALRRLVSWCAESQWSTSLRLRGRVLPRVKAVHTV